MSDKEMLDVTAEIAKEIAKDAYDDVGKPVMKPTGELVGLIPRAIKAALSPLEKWVLQKEYNVAETKKLLEEKLQNTPPELIESPEPHIAVPAMQYISYCMDNEELREMYANLLANSMNKVIKNGVHPGFVEIIKQLSPDEAKILKYLYKNPFVPTISLKVYKEPSGMVVINRVFTNVPELCGCERPYEYEKYIDNLSRLGVVRVPPDECLTNKLQYDPLKNHPDIIKEKNELEALESVARVDYIEGHIELTKWGRNFCSICVEVRKLIITKQQEGLKNDQL